MGDRIWAVADSEPPSEKAGLQREAILCVDLDGTLIGTDTSWEAMLCGLRSSPLAALRVALGFFGRRARFKQRLASLASIDVERLPYNEEVLELLKQERASGREIVLVTGSDQAFARQIAAHVGLFSEVLASDGEVNLTGREKVRKIRERFGDRPFDYIGDSFRDRHVWRHATRAFVVAPSPILTLMLGRIAPDAQIIGPTRGWRLRDLVEAMRPHQWLKNVLVFAPMLLAHEVTRLDVWLKGMLAFVCFTLSASAGYLVNDLVDVSVDRQHPWKKYRPLAAGRLPLPSAALAACLLAFLAIVTAALGISLRFARLVGTYLAGSFAYSAFLKQFVLIDVFGLAALYTLRILAGAAAVSVPVSRWLIAFSMFFFLSLAFAKRLSELKTFGADATAACEGRAYKGEDIFFLQSVGAASGYLAALVMALYVDSPEVKRLYAHPHWLWLVCPILLYWISRLWLIAQRGAITVDPVVFALEDKASYLVAVCILCVIWLAL